MAKLWAVIKREYLERVRTKWFIIATLFGPLFFAGIMVVPALMSVRSMRDAKVPAIHIVDATGTGLGEQVRRRLQPPPVMDSATMTLVQAVDTNVTLETIAPGELAAREDALVARVVAKEISGYLVLDSLTMAGVSARYAGRNASAIGEGERVEGAVRVALISVRAQQAGVDSSVAESLTRARPRLNTERITDKGRGGSGIAATVFGFGVAFLLYMMIVLYGQNILRGVLEEKTTRVAEVIVASVKPDVLLAGKVIGVGAVGLTQQFIWILSGVVFWDQRAKLLTMMGVENVPSVPFPAIEPMVLVALVGFFVLGYTFYASLFAAVGAMVGSQEEAQQAAMPVILLLVSGMIFIQPVMLDPTGTTAVVMSWLPFSAPIIMPLRMTVIPLPWWEIVGSLTGVALACVAGIWVSARIYRVGLLMYGKKPSLRELLRWIRQS
jgi:ABC-2 type transport system permease protein